MFADLSELSRNKPGGELDVERDSPVHSPREYFHSYLQSLDPERAGLTEAFRAKLVRVLGHYGIADLDRTPNWKPRSSGSSWPSSACRPTSPWCPNCCASGWPAHLRWNRSANAPDSPWNT